MSLFTITANSPEAMRDEIVKWLNHQASLNRNRARMIEGKIKRNKQEAVASAYADAADFLENCGIEHD